MLASSEDGQKEIRQSSGIRMALKIEEKELKALESGQPMREAPLDFSRMTEKQFEQWQKEQEALLG